MAIGTAARDLVQDYRLYILCNSMAALKESFFRGMTFQQCGAAFRAELRQRGYSQFDIDDLIRKTESLKQPEATR